MQPVYLEPTQAVAAALIRRQVAGPLIMLNLLRFREYADHMLGIQADRQATAAITPGVEPTANH
jgi:hypothetical protein